LCLPPHRGRHRACCCGAEQPWPTNRREQIERVAGQEVHCQWSRAT
jgi:hypothetical protein